MIIVSLLGLVKGNLVVKINELGKKFANDEEKNTNSDLIKFSNCIKQECLLSHKLAEIDRQLRKVLRRKTNYNEYLSSYLSTLLII